MRPKPLIPTRTVIPAISFFCEPRMGPYNTLTTSDEPCYDRLPSGLISPAPARGLVLQQICGEIGFGVRNAEFSGTTVRGCQQPADPARHSILGELGIVQLAQLLQARLLVLDAQHTRSTEMIWNVLAEDLQRALNPGTGRHRRACRPTKIRIVEVGEPIGGSLDLAPHPPLFPGQQGLVGTQPGQQRSNGVAVADDDPVDVAHLPRLCADSEPPGRSDQG